MERLCARVTGTMRQLAGSRAEMVGATRFFRNRKVTTGEIVETAAARTALASAERHVLLIEDTTEINYEGKAGRKRGLGRVGNGSDVGLFVHPALAVDAEDGTILGLAGATIWRRKKTKAKDYQSQPIETKESHRWIATAQRARAALVDTPLVTVISRRLRSNRPGRPRSRYLRTVLPPSRGRPAWPAHPSAGALPLRSDAGREGRRRSAPA
jgi:hypothetical protein